MAQSHCLLFHLVASLLADKWLWTYQHFVRDVPGSFDVWMEVCDAHSALPTGGMSSGACLHIIVKGPAQHVGTVRQGMTSRPSLAIALAR